MGSFFAALEAALFSLPHTIAVFLSCSVFAAGCAAPVAPVNLPPLHASHTIDVSASPTVTPKTTSVPTDRSRSSNTSGSSAESHTSIQTSNTHRGETRVTTTINGKTESYTIPESSGTQTIFISNTVNGETTTYASTTPISAEEADEMAAEADRRAAELESRIDDAVRLPSEALDTIMDQFNF